MSLIPSSDRTFVRAVSELAYANPFLPQRIELERQALGDAFDADDADWNVRVTDGAEPRNPLRIMERAEPLLASLRDRLVQGRAASDADLALYEDLALFVLFHRWLERFDAWIHQSLAGRTLDAARDFNRFEAQARELLEVMPVQSDLGGDLQHLFACLFQVRRAFHHIGTGLVGVARPMIELRAAIWQSIFTRDMRRYRRGLYSRMAEIATLITGPSGTGKELVARAIALSRYIPFDGRRFEQDFAAALFPVNLAALSPTLIESELFGHARGAFTGATGDRAGWLEACPPLGAVFLDEIGELDPGLQVKLLRVLQERTFTRLGETTARAFAGKIVAATNRDLAAHMQAGEFRADFYYRLCSDIVRTPALAEQVAAEPATLAMLVAHIARQVAGEREADPLADEVLTWVDEQLGSAYAWPGNVRELEQCVRNVMIRGRYTPTPATPVPTCDGAADGWLARVEAGELSADELLRCYCTHLYARLGQYEAVARRLGVDRRTVRARIDHDLLARLR
ncbi:MAG: sigma 54-interacting transcriptional regulator [Phycisphaeraceae bacterium]